jgi:hypothetical protein
MRGAVGTLGLTAGLLLAAPTRAQLTPPVPTPEGAIGVPLPVAAPAPVLITVDSTTLITSPVDTTRRPVAVAGIAPDAPDPLNQVTRKLAIRIGVAIAVLTLTTLLLYNVRSR